MAASTGAKSLIISYSNGIWRSFVKLLPSADSSLLAKISNLYPKILPSRSRRRKLGLPLPLGSDSIQSSLIATDTSSTILILEDIIDHTLSSLHSIQKSLLFWQSLAEGTSRQKISFMILQRGPRAFVDGTCRIITRFGTQGSPFGHLSHSAAETISANIAVLKSLQSCLATFLAEVYLEVNKFGQQLTEDSDKLLPQFLVAINSIFSKLEASISHPPEIYKSDNSFVVEEGSSCALIFEKLPEIGQEESQWTDTEIKDAMNLVHQNLKKLDSYLSFVLSRCQKPRKLTLYWLHYTCGAVGLSACSVWLLRHSRLMGSPNIDNWIREAKESTAGFWKEHVEQPLISIRDDLFETFRGRQKGVMEVEEVQLTSDSLHRMLLAFGEQTKGQKLPDNLSDQDMMEIVMDRYEKELMHPIQNLLNGELARALLIQIQKLKLDLEMAMLELDQILKDKGAEGRGRAARIQRRLLLVEVEKRIMQLHSCMDQGKEEDAQCMFGLVLYSLDRLYKAVERHARETGEWLSLREDIAALGRSELEKADKLAVISRMERMYYCLLPSLPSSRRH
ncbi:protein DGS1, mitochondrial-like isoform X2 [Asparagus officinalis]|uniref:protein DGS1, mitochondrial-like isoform X2 n=1 Tax=Asparagus officinalis TaxID=4686 RepID=UPI00098DE842|nr:protein DGS1, mitochondrial-like isoform X2 [Asparagus officinalis]